jgi:hypothetical protein
MWKSDGESHPRSTLSRQGRAGARHGSEVLQNGDQTANRHFAKIKNACGARIAIFTNRAFGGLNALFAKLQV